MTTTLPKNCPYQKNEPISNDGRKHQRINNNDCHLPIPSAFPPAHAIATISVLSGMALSRFPSMEVVDQLGTAENLSRSLFPQYLTPVQLGLIRWAFSAMVFGTGGALIFGPGKLKNRMIRTSGFQTTFSFTSWSWYLLGFYFAASGAIPLWNEYMPSSSPLPVWLLRLTVLSFHLAAPCAMLTSCIVRYALWPNAIRHGKSTATYTSVTSLITHNANVGMVLVETALLGGGVPVTMRLLSLSTLLGCSYTVFSWMIRFQWTAQKEPHFMYFFCDTTLPGLTSSMVILVLWLTLLVFYLLFYVLSRALYVAKTTFDDGAVDMEEEPPTLAYNFTVMTVMLSLLCRFRD